jgi:hypothetical protein
MKFVLGSGGSLGETPEDLYTSEPAWVEPGPSPPSSPTSGGSVFGSLFNALTQPATVTATLNKYVFGKTAPIPTATNYVPRVPGPSIIAGIPDSYLLIGGAALAFILFKGRR